MSESDFGTLNDDVDTSSTSAVIDNGLIETMSSEMEKITDPAGANKTEGDISEKKVDGEVKDDTKAGGAETDVKVDDKKDDPDRFDKHPRFRELNDKAKKADEYQKRLIETETRLKVLEEQQTKSTKEPEVNIADLSEDDIRDMMEDDPKGFYANLLQQARREILQDVTETQKEALTKEQQALRDRQVTDTFESFAETHSDFNERWDSGELKKFMDEHPGHNAISAYHELTRDEILKVELSKKEKEIEARILANIKAKGNVKSLSSGLSGREAPNTDDELINSNKYGGPKAVGIKRLIDRLKGDT